MMARRLALVAAGAFAVSVMMAGAGHAVVCDPHCAPPSPNKGGHVRGLDRANAAAGEHGKHGRDNAAQKQGLQEPVVEPAPVEQPPVQPPAEETPAPPPGA